MSISNQTQCFLPFLDYFSSETIINVHGFIDVLVLSFLLLRSDLNVLV